MPGGDASEPMELLGFSSGDSSCRRKLSGLIGVDGGVFRGGKHLNDFLIRR
jgi:hypothetical protein